MSWSVGLRIPLNASTGYGRDGIGLSRALVRAGVRVSLQPSHVYPPLPTDIADMLTVEPDERFDLLLHHIDPSQLGLYGADVEQSTVCYAWTMWEYTKFSPELAEKVAPRLTGYNRVLAYDAVSEAALSALGTPTPISILQGGYEPDEWVVEPGEPCRDWRAETFIFTIAGDLQLRKNAYAAMRVVQRLADEGYDVVLRAKSRGPLPERVTELYPVVESYYGVWSQQQMREFYSNAHVYLAPSWGEGKNLPALEAGTSGCALVLSACGGHKQWAHPAAAVLVEGTYNEYSEMPYLVVDEQKMYEECKALVEDRDKARALGRKASEIYPTTMSWDRVVRDLLQMAAKDMT